jgi:hypothetical protein
MYNPVILDIGFHFTTVSQDPLVAVFWFSISLRGNFKKGQVKRVYTGERTEAAFDVYSNQFLQSARDAVNTICDRYSLDIPYKMNDGDNDRLLSLLHERISKQWAARG